MFYCVFNIYNFIDKYYINLILHTFIFIYFKMFVLCKLSYFIMFSYFITFTCVSLCIRDTPQEVDPPQEGDGVPQKPDSIGSPAEDPILLQRGVSELRAAQRSEPSL